MPDPARAAAARNYLTSIGVQVPTARRRRPLPGLTADLAESVAEPVPLSEAEIARNADYARQHEAARQRDTSYDVDPAEMIGELGDIASMYGAPSVERAADRLAAPGLAGGALRGVASVAVPGLAPVINAGEYDPVALASSAVPLADEAIAAGESILGGRSYREAQAQREQQFAESRERSPGSALAGSLAQGIVAAPAASGVTVAQGAGAGTALGAAGGYLGSEGQSGIDRANATIRGALTGGAEGTYAGGLAHGGRLFAEGGESALGVIGRGLVGGTAEGAGYGIGQGAIESGGRVGSREQLRDAAIGGGIGGAFGSVPGLVGGIARSTRPRGAVPGLARDATPVEIDETALLDAANDADPEISLLTGTGSQRIADLQRLRAAGALDRSTLRRVARAFHPGNAREGVARAARVARESGISPAGEFQSLDTTLARAARERVSSGQQLRQLHGEVAERGGVFRGDALAEPLERRAAELSRMRSPDESVRAEIAALRSRADDLRYGSEGMTPERANLERFRAAPFADPSEVGLRQLPDDVAGLPSIEPEVRGMTEREFLRPQVMPYEEGRAMERNIIGRMDPFNRTREPLDGTTAARLLAEHRALVPERNAAARAMLGERYATEMRPANERFRLAATLVPENVISNAEIMDPGQLTGALNAALNSGSFSLQGQKARIGERVFRQFEPSLNAMLAERAASSRPVGLGAYADRLRLADPERMALAPAAIGGAIGPGDEVEQARRDLDAERRRAEVQRMIDEEAGGFARFAPQEAIQLTPEEEEEAGGFGRFVERTPQ